MQVVLYLSGVEGWRGVVSCGPGPSGDLLLSELALAPSAMDSVLA